MKYYKRVNKSAGTDYFAVQHNKTEVMTEALEISTLMNGCYWIENIWVYVQESFEEISEEEFMHEYQRAITSFNLFLTPETNG